MAWKYCGLIAKLPFVTALSSQGAFLTRAHSFISRATRKTWTFAIYGTEYTGGSMPTCKLGVET